MTQMTVILGTIAGRFGLALEDPREEASPEPLLSIWPRGGLRGRLVSLH
jgi:hypothetical protein